MSNFANDIVDSLNMVATGESAEFLLKEWDGVSRLLGAMVKAEQPSSRSTIVCNKHDDGSIDYFELI